MLWAWFYDLRPWADGRGPRASALGARFRVPVFQVCSRDWNAAKPLVVRDCTVCSSVPSKMKINYFLVVVIEVGNYIKS